jgi:hypothetical protein
MALLHFWPSVRTKQLHRQFRRREVGNVMPEKRFLDDDQVHKLASRYFEGNLPIGRLSLGQRRGHRNGPRNSLLVPW